MAAEAAALAEREAVIASEAKRCADEELCGGDRQETAANPDPVDDDKENEDEHAVAEALPIGMDLSISNAVGLWLILLIFAILVLPLVGMDY